MALTRYVANSLARLGDRDAPTIEAFDENRWVALLRYREADPGEALARILGPVP